MKNLSLRLLFVILLISINVSINVSAQTLTSATWTDTLIDNHLKRTITFTLDSIQNLVTPKEDWTDNWLDTDRSVQIRLVCAGVTGDTIKSSIYHQASFVNSDSAAYWSDFQSLVDTSSVLTSDSTFNVTALTTTTFAPYHRYRVETYAGTDSSSGIIIREFIKR